MEFKNVEDLIEFLVNAEQKAFNLYTKLATQSNNKEMVHIFTEYAKDAMKHINRLKEVKKDKLLSFSVEDISPDKFVVPNEYPIHISYLDALSLAIKREKSQYKLYSLIASKCEEKGTKEIFTSMAKVVATHNLRFEVEYDEYAATHTT